MRRKYRRSCSLLTAWLIMLSVLLVGFPASVSAQEFDVESVEMFWYSEVEIEFSVQVSGVNEEGVSAEGLKNGQWYPVPISLSHAGQMVYVTIEDNNVEDYTEFRIHFEPDSIENWDSTNSQSITVNVVNDMVKDFYVSLSSLETGSIADLMMSFVATRSLVAYEDVIKVDGLDYILEYYEPEFISLVVNGATYPVYGPSEGGTINIQVPVSIDKGEKVTILMERVELTDTETYQFIELTTTKNTTVAISDVYIYDNSGKHPVNVEMTPVTVDGEETVAITGESTWYELTFTTEVDIEEGYMLQLDVPYGFGLLGQSEFPPSLQEEAEEYVEITVTDTVYYAPWLRATGLEVNYLEITTEGDIPAHSEVTILFKDLFVNPSLPGQYVFSMVELNGNESIIHFAVTIEPAEDETPDPGDDPAGPLVIEDLELQLSNYNSYQYLPIFSEFLYLFGNGENVEYTFTGTAPVTSGELSLTLDEIYFLNEGWDDPTISDVSLKINETEVPVEASLDGSTVYIHSASSEESLVIYEGDRFELQVTMNNPEFYGEGEGMTPLLELRLGEAIGTASPEIVMPLHMIAMAENYAGIQNGEYLLMASALYEPFSELTIHFPDEVELPDTISLDAIDILPIMIEGDPQVEQIIVDGQSVHLLLDRSTYAFMAIVLGDAGIPTPLDAGTYEYTVTAGGVDSILPAQFAALPQHPDPKALTASISEESGDTIMINVRFDKELDSEYAGLPVRTIIGLLNETLELPIKVEYEFAGEVYEIPACNMILDEWDASSVQVELCAQDDMPVDFERLIEQLNASTEAYFTFDNVLIRHSEGSFSEGQQRVKIMTEALAQAIELKLMELVPQAERLNIGMLLNVMNDEGLIDLFGGELNVYNVEHLLQYIEPKFITDAMPAS